MFDLRNVLLKPIFLCFVLSHTLFASTLEGEESDTSVLSAPLSAHAQGEESDAAALSARARTTQLYENPEEALFQEALIGIKTAFGDKISQCFISRAWEEDITHQHHALANRLCNDLKTAGISAIIDANDLLMGSSITEYIQKIDNDRFFVIALFTPTYQQRMSLAGSWISKEVTLIINRLKRNDFFYIPLLIEGEQSSIPACLNPTDRLYKDFHHKTEYHKNVLEILHKKLLKPEGLKILSDNEWSDCDDDETQSLSERALLDMHQEDAEQGNTIAQLSLAYAYENGWGVKKNKKRFLKWCRMAADEENVEALTRLGRYYLETTNFHDKEEAVKCFMKATEQEDEANAEAYSCLGYCYLNGIGIEEDTVQAVNCFKKAVAHGNNEAKTFLGICYQNGDGIEKDEAEAVRLFESASYEEDRARYCLGFCYAYGFGTDVDLRKAVKLWKDASKDGNVDAKAALGYFYENGIGVKKDIAEAIRFYRLGIKQKNGEAHVRLGYCYENGIGVIQDKAAASQLYHDAVVLDTIIILKYNPNHSVVATGTLINLVTLREMYENLAHRGDPIAQHNLACCYLRGEGVKQDESLGVYWFFLAAEHGFAPAQCNLGICYKNEYGGLARDDEQSAQLYQRAAEQGHLYARALLNSYIA